MNVSDFDYVLPRESIAQEPLPRRDDSRLLALDRDGGAVAHRRFAELPGLFDRGDLFVLNDTRVVPARLFGSKPTGGGVEVLLLERAGGTEPEPVWRCLLRASRAPAPGTRIAFGQTLSAEVRDRTGDRWELCFRDRAGDTARSLARSGRMPLPPYIERRRDDPRSESDLERYQTVYASRPGAVAAPTAGLHFTDRLLGELDRRGIEIARLTLHVGPGTFQPVRGERVEDHRMDAEWFELPGATADAIAAARSRGRRVVAVGTTVVRVLEERACGGGRVDPGSGWCRSFVYPGYRFKVVDAMVTNFHLPRSTLLMLVSAFAGREAVLAAYEQAVRLGYRFYSYGDAMVIRSG